MDGDCFFPQGKTRLILRTTLQFIYLNYLHVRFEIKLRFICILNHTNDFVFDFLSVFDFTYIYNPLANLVNILKRFSTRLCLENVHQILFDYGLDFSHD